MALRDGEIKRTALCFVFDRANHSLLMILKKRGQGAGKINVPGGKLRSGEDAEAAAVRETEEETGITPLDLREAGKLEFYFPENNNWDNTCTVFTAENFSGTLISQNEECDALWVNIDQIPIEKMWDADRLWLPLLLQGKWFHRAYTFDAHDRVCEEKSR